jgi:ribonuclease P protein component
VLDRRHRLTSSVLFTTAARRGRRTGTRTVVLHLLADRSASTGPDGSVEPQVGFVVSKAVGNAVARNAVKRRLRHLARTRISALPGRSVLVVRALPPAADATYAQLGSDLDAALHRLRRLPEPGRRSGSRAGSLR